MNCIGFVLVLFLELLLNNIFRKKKSIKACSIESKLNQSDVKVLENAQGIMGNTEVVN